LTHGPVPAELTRSREICRAHALRWGDIDWHRGAIRVTCPKLEHIESCAYRTIPLFPELGEHLLKLFTETPDGVEYVLTKHRLGSLNLRQQFERIIARAGKAQWPRLFHNLRASRETELLREYDLATVCKWIGNSPAVAAKHYATSVDLNADFRRAVGAGKGIPKAQQKAQQSAAGSVEQGMTTPTPQDEETPENRGSVVPCQSLASAGETGRWAIQDSNL